MYTVVIQPSLMMTASPSDSWSSSLYLQMKDLDTGIYSLLLKEILYQLVYIYFKEMKSKPTPLLY